MDLTNAFNSVHRAAVMGALEELSPALLPWTRFCLQPAPLFCGGKAIMSTRGVQEGDPLGPLFFAAALDPAIKGIPRGAVVDSGTSTTGRS